MPCNHDLEEPVNIQWRREYAALPADARSNQVNNQGLILYNSQNAGRTTDFLALQLLDGIPEFILETGNGPVSVKGDRPLALNEWYTIRLIKLGTKVTMYVENFGPFEVDTPENWILELQQPLYIGGVPDYNQLPEQLAGATGFAGCVSMLVLGREEKNIMMSRLDQYRVETCDTCAGNTCQNGGICQNCERRGEACRAGLCGTGRCTNTADGYKCACPVTHTGRNAYAALKPPDAVRYLSVSMKIKASAPVTDGIIMYCAESPRGHGGFTSLVVRNGHLEFRKPVVLVSKTPLAANDWTDVQVTRSGADVSLIINLVHKYNESLDSTRVSHHEH
ncbi:Basement membrane-specific heparan sulfate proteoglycan core protein [Operophtera brumata]|uniref:Basement membrane-specific heparan sulfate proteoglycan core protein n=1 Tax=Operophtera brumata TaxID=104452 RepID=A0A0L7L1E6_OPEBR|nr:Basement membrane-specific heparan sulfate proteoglycan core protein [Operophtera brumata]